MIQDEYTGLIYEPIIIKKTKNNEKNRKNNLMKTLKNKFNQLKLIVKEAVKKQSLVDQENTGIDTDLLTSNEVNNLVIIDKIKMERDLWKSSYLSLYNAMKEKEKIENLIKSML